MNPSLKMQTLRCMAAKTATTLALASAAPCLTAVAQAPDVALQALLPSQPAVPATSPVDSDVVFSPRFDRPESVAVARAFGSTRLEWTYMTEGTTLTALRAIVKGGGFGAAINNNTPTPGDSGAARDFDGKVMVAPWMVSRATPWNTCAAPDSQQALTDWVDRVLAAGATNVQFDDPGMQFDAAGWGVGDFSAHSLQGFKTWVQARRAAGEDTSLTPEQAGNYRGWLRQTQQVTDNTDYIRRQARFASTPLWRAYLQDTVHQCVADLRSHLLRRSQGRSTLSFNLYTPYPWSANAFLQPMADYIIGEVAPDQRQLHQLQFMAAWLRAQGQRWAPVFPGTDKALLRRQLSLAYAVGATPVVPWDMYVPPAPGQTQDSRYFGAPKDFADLFQFVRSQAVLLDGWQTLSRVDLLVYRDPATAAETLAQLRRLGDLRVPYATILRESADDSTRPRPGAGRSIWRSANTSARAFADDRQPLLAQLTDSGLLANAAVSDITPGFDLIAKGKLAAPGRRVLHLLRTGTGANAGAPAEVHITLNAWLLPGQAAYRLQLHRPGSDSTELGQVRIQADKRLRISVPAPAEWALLELTPV